MKEVSVYVTKRNSGTENRHRYYTIKDGEGNTIETLMTEKDAWKYLIANNMFPRVIK